MSIEVVRPEVVQSGVNALLLLGPALIGALTEGQRLAVLTRDGFKCQVKELGIAHKCNGKERWKNGHFKLQVDHIIPSRWQQRVLGKSEEEVDGDPNILITECEHFHQTIRHPDMEEARAGYAHDKNSFLKVFQRRDEACDRGEVYWYSVYDNTFLKRARELTQRALSKGWHYPDKSGNGYHNGGGEQ